MAVAKAWVAAGVAHRAGVRLTPVVAVVRGDPETAPLDKAEAVVRKVAAHKIVVRNVAARRLAVLAVTALVPKVGAASKTIAAARKAPAVAARKVPAISKAVRVVSKVPDLMVKVRVDSKVVAAARSKAPAPAGGPAPSLKTTTSDPT